jgi:hypothetical protein
MNFRFFYLALFVAVGHMVSGVIAFIEPETIKVTPLAYLTKIASTDVAAGFLIFASVLVVFAFWYNLKLWITLLMLLPQQFLLAMSFISIVLAVTLGHYPDGYTPKGAGLFITNDQIWMSLFCIAHTVEYISAQRPLKFNLP